MRRLKESAWRFLTEQKGSQVTEFGIYAALVIAGAILLLGGIGTKVVAAYQQISGAL